MFQDWGLAFRNQSLRFRELGLELLELASGVVESGV